MNKNNPLKVFRFRSADDASDRQFPRGRSEKLELGPDHDSRPVRVRSASRSFCSFSWVRIHTIVLSRQFRLTGSVVGGMRWMSLLPSRPISASAVSAGLSSTSLRGILPIDDEFPKESGCTQAVFRVNQVAQWDITLSS
jgi:hypothetical protein